MTEQTTGNNQADEPPLLRDAMKISAAVNAFTSPEVQLFMAEALVRQYEPNRGSMPPLPQQQHGPVTITSMPYVSAPAALPAEEATEEVSVPVSRPVKRPARKATAKKNFTVPRDLNFAPEGKPSLADFVAEKRPRNIDEKNLLACYYLREMLGIEEISIGHVLAVYKAAGWNAPGQPDTQLRNTAARLSWIDTANMKDIKVVWGGEHHVETKMPTTAERGK
jgi:hypothetical protein